MKQIEVSSLHLKARFNAPASSSEYNELANAGKPPEQHTDACVDSANGNAVYRDSSGLPLFREKVVKLITEETGIAPRKIETGDKNEDGTPEMVEENEGSFVKHVRQAKGWSVEAYVAAIQPLVDTKIGILTLDVKDKPRKSAKEEVLPAKYRDIATRVWANGNQVARSAEYGYTLTGDDAKDKEGFGWAVRAWALKEEAARAAAIS